MNNLKTTLLLGALTGLVVGVGYYLGGQSGALLALVLSAVMNFTSYWFSHKIVLSLYRATEMSQGDHPRIHAIVEELSIGANIPKPKLYLVDLPVPNAFATGRNEDNAVVAVTTGILDLLSDSEIRGVLAHELSHIKNKDILISTIAATLAGAISYLAQIVYFGGSRNSNREGGSLISILVLTILTPIIASMLSFAVSRSREYLADETGARISRDPEGLAGALQKLHNYSLDYPLDGEPKHEATAHMFIVNPFKPGVLVSLFSTHPPMSERVRRLREMRIN